MNSRTSRGSFMAQRNHPFKSKTVSWPSPDLQNLPRSSLRGNFQGSLRRSIRGLKINENQQIRREDGDEKIVHPTPPLPPRSPTWKETLEKVFEAPLDLKRAELQHQLQGEYQLSNFNSKNFDPIKTNKQKIRVKKDAVYKFFSLRSQIDYANVIDKLFIYNRIIRFKNLGHWLQIGAWKTSMTSNPSETVFLLIPSNTSRPTQIRKSRR